MLWSDGRSGVAGCIAGSIALGYVPKRETPVRKLKGTTFETASAFIIGRMCATDEYLREPVLHWANAWWDQHIELKSEAEAAKKDLVYLFITASSDPPSVRYWRVPAAVVEAQMIARGKNHRGDTCAVHIVASHAKHFIGKSDVTKYFVPVALQAAEARQLREAFKAPKRSIRSVRSQSKLEIPRYPAGLATFDIPASGARSIRIQAHLPLLLADVDRLKRWIDLTTDVLTESSDPGDRDETAALAEQIQAGLDQLDRGDTVEGEQAFDRILSHRRRPRKARS